MSQFKKNGTMELETSIGYSFSLIKTEYKQNKIYQNKKKTKRTVNLSFQSALCQQSELCFGTVKSNSSAAMSDIRQRWRQAQRSKGSSLDKPVPQRPHSLHRKEAEHRLM